jgi:hypothetical protein
MALAGSLALYEDGLLFMGAFVSFSITFISYRGLRKTESPTMLRLAVAFLSLGLGFILEGLYGVGNEDLIPGIATFTATLLIAGLLLETAGYFFLAFSHLIDVLSSKQAGITLAVLPVIMFNGSNLENILRFLSFYFVLYGVVETLYSYVRTRKPDTLLIASGLGMIAAGTFTYWLYLLHPEVQALSLIQLIIKEMGIMILFVPVLRFTFKKESRINGAV